MLAPTEPVKISRVNTNAATASNVWFEHIKENIKRGLPRLHHLPEFKKIKGFENPIALVGGGPSLKDHLDELRTFKTIMVAGSAHDFLRKHDITPSYAAVCDPDKISSYYLRQSDPQTTYLLATNCHEEVFKVLKDRKIILWHCYSDDPYVKQVMEIEPDYQAVAGGCTVGLRCLSIALMFGYSNIHFFGYDSCLSETEDAYAYKTDERDNMLDLLGTVYEIGVGLETPSKKRYKCLGYQIAQAQHFLDFHRVYGGHFKCTFHGDGLLKETYAVETGVK